MSVVWRAHDDVLDRMVAVKVLSDAVEPRLRPRLRAEARAAAALSHPSIAQVYDYGEAAGSDGGTLPYLVMELVDGTPLDQYLAGGRSVSWAEASAVCAAIADALITVHASGLVHRDIKPANVILTGRGPKLVDFGICALVGAADPDDGELLGTPAYVAPERIADAPTGPAADLYALGVLFYRMVAGTLPWSVDSATGLLLAHMYTDPAPLPPVPGLPGELAELATQCLDKDPTHRPSAARYAAIAGAAVPAETPATETPATETPATGSSAEPAAAETPGLEIFGSEAGDSTAPVPATRAQPISHLTVPVRSPRSTTAGRRALVTAVSVVAVLGLLGLLWSSQDRPHPTTAMSAGAASRPCDAVFAVRRDTGGSFDAVVTVHDRTLRLAVWTVSFTFPGDQAIKSTSTLATSAASAPSVPVSLRQSGTRVVVVTTRATDVVPGATLTIPVSGTYRAGNPLPTAVWLGDQLCATQVAGAPTAPSAQPTRSVPPTAAAGGGGGPGAGGPGPGGPGPGKGKGKGKN